MSWTVPIRAAAQPAWRALQAALKDAGPTACRDHVEWISADVDAREYAVHHCSTCPVLRLCGAYADAAKEREGVWGGIDRTPGKSQPTTLPLFDTTEEIA